MLYSRPDIRVSQCTLNQPIHCSGIGPQHRRQVTLDLLPAPVGSGIHVLRRDVDIARGLIASEWHNIVETHPRTLLANEHGVSVSGIEPLMAALRGCGIDNVLIEVNDCEIPLLDGSSASWVAMISRAGIIAQGMARYGMWIDDFVAVRSGEHYAFVKPSVMPAITIDVKSRDGDRIWNPLSLGLLDHVFEYEIAPARNPDFIHLVDSGFDSTESYTGKRDEPRFSDEAARYRVLECLGMLAFADAPLFGHLYLYNPSSFLLHALLSELSEARDTWRVMSYAKINQMTGGVASASYQKREVARNS
jgi:UDP-3-O-[3-hydroxymyristoyl] N-acetylglucosamine deacetylase